MDVVPVITTASSSKRKRQREGDSARRKKKKRLNNVGIVVKGSHHVASHDSVSSLTLLDLPGELLTEIFLLSANAALPETCWALYTILCANPRTNMRNDGPPMWLQLAFVQNTNPTISFAVEKCLRRRFFGAETFKACLPELLATKSLDRLTVPLRCLTRSSGRTREFLLYTELFLNGIRLTRSSRDKALVYICNHYPHAEPSSHFWKATSDLDFSTSTILQAFTCAANKRFFEPTIGTFDFLVQRFGIDEDIGESLFDLAASHHDQQLISILQRHGVRPSMAALQKLMKAY